MTWSTDATVRSRAEDRGGSSGIVVVRILETPERAPGQAELAVLTESRSVVIGRDDAATLRLKDGRVSRVHATLTQVDGHVHVVDSSANGTFLDGEPVTSAPVGDGAILRVGDTFLVVRMIAQDQADADVDELLGEAPSVQELRRSIALMAPTDAAVLVLGESGTGKELVARALHRLSDRPGDMVAVNCAAIPAELAESQLFGHVAGAFTGAQRAHDGYFRAANHGTLFLDEIGDLPASVQPKLLRVLEERAVVPVGATKPIPVDIRLVSATHRDLEAGIDAGWFRGDLYSRLSDLVLGTPPLRKHREDVLPLLRHALDDDRPFDPELVDALLNAPWRFNVRELFKVARELTVRVGDAERFELNSVKTRLARAVVGSPGAALASAEGAAAEDAAAKHATVKDAAAEKLTETPAPTRDELIALLEQCRGNVSHVAKAASRSRKQIYRYLDEHGLDASAYRPSKR